MYSNITVHEQVARIHVYGGWGLEHHVRLIGSTFPIVPPGTIVERLFVKVPGGLQGIMFFCKTEGPRQMGSGKTAYLDHTPQISASVLLSWEENSKPIVKADKDMSASELAQFNPFVRSDADVLVVDSERTIVYMSDLLPHKAADSAWTYKFVPMKAILEYITKKLTMEQLDERATSEQKARDELSELRGQNCVLQGTCDRQKYQSALDNKHYNNLALAYNELTRALTKSEGLHKLLECLPAKFRPKAFDGFVEAMGSFNRSATI